MQLLQSTGRHNPAPAALPIAVEPSDETAAADNPLAVLVVIASTAQAVINKMETSKGGASAAGLKRARKATKTFLDNWCRSDPYEEYSDTNYHLVNIINNALWMTKPGDQAPDGQWEILWHALKLLGANFSE